MLEIEQPGEIIPFTTLLGLDGSNKLFVLILYLIVDLYVIQIAIYIINRNMLFYKIKELSSFLRYYHVFNWAWEMPYASDKELYT